MKKLIVFLGVIALGIYAYTYYVVNNNDMYVSFPSGAREKVPDDIVKSRDCERYKEWYLTQSLVKHKVFLHIAKCPWRKPFGEYGYFEINGVKLKVPRKDLDTFFDTDIPDGEETDLRLRFVYPEMSAASETPYSRLIYEKCPNGPNPKWGTVDGSILNYNIINVAIKLGGIIPRCKEEGICDKHYSCKTRAFCKLSLLKFGLLTHSDDESSRLSYKPQFKFIKKEFDMDVYRLSLYHPIDKDRYDSAHYYVKGDNPFEPEEWIECARTWEDICTGRLTYCTTVFGMMDDKIIVEYRFLNNKFLPKHKELKKLVMEKINSYVFNN